MNKISFLLIVFISSQLFSQPPSLKNLGNTCYMNATIQALYNIPALNNLLLVNQTAFASDQNSLGYLYINLIDKFNEKKYNPKFNINNLNTALKKFATKTDEEIEKNDKVGGCAQHDSAEYLGLLLNNLQELGGEPTKEGINNICGIDSISEIFCPTIPFISETSEHQLYLTVNVTNVQGEVLKTLQDCLNEYFKKEQLDEFKPKDYDLQTNCTKQFLLEKTYDIFIINLKKYRRTLGGGIQKIDYPINIPFQLELKPFFKSTIDKLTAYRLIGAIQQRGTAGGGHYVAYVREQELQKWFLCNDSSINEISLPDLMRQLNTSYLFFYSQGEATKQELEMQKKVPKPGIPIAAPLSHSLDELTQKLTNLSQELQRN